MPEAFLLLPLPAEVRWVDYVDAAFPAAHLLHPQPKVVYAVTGQGSAAWGTRVEFDLGADHSIDTLALLHHSGGPGFWQVLGRTQADGPFTPAVPGNEGAAETQQLVAYKAWTAPATGQPSRFHAVEAMPAAKAVRYVRLILFSPGGGPMPWTAGGFLIGKRIQPAWGVDWGHGRRVLDLSDRRELDGGELVFWRKGRAPMWRATFGNLSPAELAAVWALLLEAGTSAPILAVERTDGPTTHEAIHYGVVDRLDFDERHDASKGKIELIVREWL